MDEPIDEADLQDETFEDSDEAEVSEARYDRAAERNHERRNSRPAR